MKSNRIVWALTLLFYVSGCTAYSPAYLPGQELPETQTEDESTPLGDEAGNTPEQFFDEIEGHSDPAPPGGAKMVCKGMNVRLTLIDGGRKFGTVVEINDDSLAFGIPGNYGLKMEYYSFADIAKVEVAHSSGLSNALLVPFLVIIALFVAAAISLSNTDMSGLS